MNSSRSYWRDVFTITATLAGLTACAPWLHGPNYWAELDGYDLPATQLGSCGGRTAPGLKLTSPGGVAVGMIANWHEERQALDIDFVVEVPPGKSAQFERRIIHLTDPETATTIEWDPPYFGVSGTQPFSEWADFLAELHGGSREFPRQYFTSIAASDFKPGRLEIRVPPMTIDGRTFQFPAATFVWEDRRRAGVAWACI